MKDVPPALARDEVITDEFLSDSDADFVVHSKPKPTAKPASKPQPAAKRVSKQKPE